MVDSWRECTHLVTDKIKRTTKFLCCLSSGKRIVSMDWIQACQKSKSIIDDSLFALKDKEKEKQFHFSLSQSIERVHTNGASQLMANMKFLITPSVQPDFSEMSEIIEAAGGCVLNDLPLRVEPETFIIGCAEDEELLRDYRSFGWQDRVMSTEFILSASLKQELDFTLRLPSKSHK